MDVTSPNFEKNSTDSVLKYKISSYSSYSANYHPTNVLVNNPLDQSSRWSSGSNNQQQYLTIELANISAVNSITFGKYHKVHVCNLKEFQVFIGLEENNLCPVLHAGLRNDNQPETFALKYSSIPIPTKFIKIKPLVSFGANFNFSIWHLQVNGIDDYNYIQSIVKDYTLFRETEAIRLCLKFFRQKNYTNAFTALQATTSIQLEDPLLTQLHQLLVVDGQFGLVEELLMKCANDGVFNEHIHQIQYQPKWSRIAATDNDGESPCSRGNGLIYLMGGWDGTRDLSDFWVYSEDSCLWKLLSADTRKQGGPGPRSCHKICFDDKRKQIYCLGRYIDTDSRSSSSLESDFYRYDTAFNQWYKLSSNTQAEGGPELVYDHQMCMDSERQIIYVFGGRSVQTDINSHSYSGLYSFDNNRNQWKLLLNDSTFSSTGIHLKSRIGHSMLFCPANNHLLIFAGQRNKDYLSDFYSYNLTTHTIDEVSRDYSKQGGPDAGFTQRSAIDLDRNEFYVFSGLMREKATAQESVKNALWVYSLSSDKWTRVYHNDSSDPQYWSKMKDVEPCPRFAHQVVYNTERKVLHLFGGNPGDSTNPKLRLDDFWSLQLFRPGVDSIIRKSLFLLRKQQFLELCTKGNSIEALLFLQGKLHEVVNHNNEKEEEEFAKLTMGLFQMSGAKVWEERMRVYEELVGWFPERMREPKGSLVEMINLMD